MTTHLIDPPPLYAPKTGSIAAKVLAFFDENPDEELTRADIAAKFDASVGSIDQLLSTAVARECLEKTRNSDMEVVWRPGRCKPQLPEEEEAPLGIPRLGSKPVNSPFALAAEIAFDPEDITIRKGVPLRTPAQQLEDRFVRLFDGFEVGDSAEIDAHWREVVEAACKRYCKAKKKRFIFLDVGNDKVGLERKA